MAILLIIIIVFLKVYIFNVFLRENIENFALHLLYMYISIILPLLEVYCSSSPSVGGLVGHEFRKRQGITLLAPILKLLLITPRLLPSSLLLFATITVRDIDVQK